MIVDVDIHEAMASKQDLVPFLSGHWRNVLETYLLNPTPVGGPAAWFPQPPTVEPPAQWRLSDEGDLYSRGGTSLAALREHLFEQQGHSIGILNGMVYPDAYPGYHDFAAALGAAYNDWQIANWLEPEPRLYGSVHVSTDDPLAAAREIDRVAEHPQIVQVLLPLVGSRQYGAPVYRPIFAAAARNDLVVAMHPAFVTQPILGPARNLLEWHTLAAGQAAAAHLLNLLASGLFDEYPDLRLVILESGVAWLPWLMLRADEQFKELRAEIPWVKRTPSAHIRSNVRLSTQPFGDIGWQDFVTLVEMTDSADVFLFATDYPHYDADQFATAFPPRMPAELRDKVASGNALATYPRLG